MPQKYCTTSEIQRRKWLDLQYQKISNGLSIFKNSERLSNDQLAKGMDSNPKVIAKLLHGEQQKIDIDTFFLAMNAAGYMLAEIPREKVAAP